MEAINRSISMFSSLTLLLVILLHPTVHHEHGNAVSISSTGSVSDTNNNNQHEFINNLQDVKLHPTITFTNQNQVIWDHFLSKYSASKSYLSRDELFRMVTNLQKCDTTKATRLRAEEEDANNFRLRQPSVNERLNPNRDTSSSSSSVCNANAISNNEFRSLADLNQVCHQILFQIDNADCCGQIQNPGRQQQNPEQNHMVDDLRNQHREFHEPVFSSLGDVDGPHVQATGETKKKPTAGEVWGYGVLLVTIISACSVVGVSVIPLMGKKMYKYILTTMIGLAVGSLTGSSIFHLMPQAFNLSEHYPCHSYLITSLVIFGGIWMFFMVERLLKIVMDYKDRKDKPWQRVKVSSTLSNTPESSTISMLVDNNSRERHSSSEEAAINAQRETELIYESQEQAIKASFGHQEKPKVKGHDHTVKFQQGKDSVIATVAWMIIFGDGLHNFIDGLSIGAALNESILTGVSISVAVFCEELPHELGDFAVLLNAGMSMRQAVMYNFLSACTCYLGMAVGIFLGKVEASNYIFALASGMFLYISLVDMVPEMNEVAEQSSKISVKKGLFVLFLQNVGIFVGVIALFVLAKYQDSIKF